MTLLSCADRLATRGRKADEAIAAHLELARELMAAALAWRADGPPAPPRARARAGPRAGHGAGARAGAAAARGSRRPPSPARRATASRRSSSPGPCGRIPTGDRRLRDLRGGASPRRRRSTWRTPTGSVARTAASRGSGCYEPSEEEFESLSREFDLHPAGRGGRDPRAPASEARDVRRHGAARAEDRALRRPERGRGAGRDPGVRRPGLRDHRPARRGQRPARRARAPRGQPGAAGARGRARSCTRSWTRSWTTTSPRSTASRRTSRRWRTRSSRRPGRTAPSASTGSSARRSTSTTRPLRCWRRSTGWRAATTRSSRPRCAPTSGT